ncbi:MAG: ATP-binding protein [Leptospiraceae bacterium]|nr:ATP-binding protein [Leptospiraceae bacterium]MCP5513115.1 ATP-binding protein [Leptospiraceae bacterium]
MFVPPDMESVKRFRDEIKKSLEEHTFPGEDIQQIELACDEALTNSITANINNDSRETIICRWRISDEKFTLFIMDYGRGVPSEQMKSIQEKPKNIQSIMERLKEAQKKNPKELPYGTNKKKHKNMGQGLNIIRNIMDTVKVFYHCNGNVSEMPEEKINGSIMEFEFSCKKRT